MTTWSPQQEAIFDALEHGTENLLIDAVAGSGKTTTIIEGAARLALQGKRIKFLAFNKNIDEELGQRLPKGVHHSTFHSFGLEALRGGGLSTSSFIKIDADKCRNILKQKWPKFFRDYAAPVTRLIGYAKNVGIGTDMEDVPTWDDLILHYQLQIPEECSQPRVIELASEVLAASNHIHHVVDFDDMLYLPLLLHKPFPSYDIIFIDEAQDTNGVQRELLKAALLPARTTPTASSEAANRLVQPSPVMMPRLIAVGDPFQAIYGFRGADAAAMTTLKETFNMKELPLSVSYRCSKAVCEEAQRILQTI